MTTLTPACDGEKMSTVSAGQHWRTSWHPPDLVPGGRNHGSAGICVGNDGRDLVLISPDQVHWGFPAGRPEEAETLEETLRREMWEEACVEVREATLLGFARSVCVQGHEQGLVLVRSFWLAQVQVGEWKPEFEIAHRKIIPAVEATSHVRDSDATVTRISMRALAEARLGK